MRDNEPKRTISLDIEVGTKDWILYSYVLNNVYDLGIMGENLVIKYFGSDPKNRFVKVIPIEDIARLSYERNR